MLKRFAAIDISLDSRDQQGWLDNTYLDDDLQVNSRGGTCTFKTILK